MRDVEVEVGIVDGDVEGTGGDWTPIKDVHILPAPPVQKTTLFST